MTSADLGGPIYLGVMVVIITAGVIKAALSDYPEDWVPRFALAGLIWPLGIVIVPWWLLYCVVRKLRTT